VLAIARLEIPPSPFEGQGRLLPSGSISRLSLRLLSFRPTISLSTLHITGSVTGHHARLGTRLPARLYRCRHSRRHGPMRFQGATLADPDARDSRIRLLSGELRSQQRRDEQSWLAAAGGASGLRSSGPIGPRSVDLAGTTPSARSARPCWRTNAAVDRCQQCRSRRSGAAAWLIDGGVARGRARAGSSDTTRSPRTATAHRHGTLQPSRSQSTA
jgi:hypothetical protein